MRSFGNRSGTGQHKGQKYNEEREADHHHRNQARVFHGVPLERPKIVVPKHRARDHPDQAGGKGGENKFWEADLDRPLGNRKHRRYRDRNQQYAQVDDRVEGRGKSRGSARGLWALGGVSNEPIAEATAGPPQACGFRDLPGWRSVAARPYPQSITSCPWPPAWPRRPFTS